MESLKAQDFDDYFVIREELYPSFFFFCKSSTAQGMALD